MSRLERVESAGMRRTGPTWAASQNVSLGRNMTLITVTRANEITVFNRQNLSDPLLETDNPPVDGLGSCGWTHPALACQLLSI